MTAVFRGSFTDYGFKRLFGEEASKPFLIDFLNAILPAKHCIANFDSQEMTKYRHSLKVYWDNYNVMYTAKQEGIEQGKRQQAIKTAMTLKKLNTPIQTIIEATQSSAEEIERL